MTLPYTANTPVRVTSPYGWRKDPFGIEENNVPHQGVDLVSDGDKTVRAVCGGAVWFSRRVLDENNRTSEWGNYVCIQGDDGLTYYYCHLDERLVSAGERVEAGQAIGIEGSTGKVTGRHLHFEVRKNGVAIDPTQVLGIPNVVGTYIVYDEQEDDSMDEAKKKQTDSEPSDWAKDAVEWAVENGIIYGDENGDPMLRKPCTREQMLVFLYRFAQWLGRA